MNLFLDDKINNVEISWQNLIDKINSTQTYNPFCTYKKTSDIFTSIIISMLLEKEIFLLDGDFSDVELQRLTGKSNFDSYTMRIDKTKNILHNKGDLLSRLKNTGKQWSISLFTSGTTGIPTKVTHNFESISRFVKINPDKQHNIWGFAYNPTHMAGVQVFLQALLNGNSLIMLNNLNKSEVFNQIELYGITHISATPTFYRLLLPATKTFPTVVRISSGGEKFSQHLVGQLNSSFPNAMITNIYATTESGTLFASENDIFSIKPEFEKLVKIENGELIIHNKLMGKTEINFGEWYNTGDLIEIVSKSPLKFRFISRKSEMINVGGYKVNPSEVEEVILSIPGLKNVKVFAKTNSVLGNIVCCEIVSEIQYSEAEIRKNLQSKLQEFKIPRIIKFVEEISLTRTGKIKRT